MSSANLKNKRSFTESNSVSTSTDTTIPIPLAPSEPNNNIKQEPHITNSSPHADTTNAPHATTLTHSTSESKEDTDVRMENASTPPPVHKRPRTVDQESNSGLALSPSQQETTAVQTEPIGMSAETQTDPSVTLVSPISLPMTILSHINSPPSADSASIAHSTTRLSVGTPPQVSVTYQYSIPPASAVKSPRRATVCASLELAAAKSASLTNTTIHPAILHSLSVRLQAMSDEEAEIVLRRLQQLAAHIDSQRHRNEMQQQMRNIMHQAAQAKRNRSRDLFRSETSQPNNISPSQSRGNTPASTMLTAATAPSALPPPSPTMPGLGSVSSLDSGNTSDTTSPALSPAVGAATPPAPPSPALIHHTMSVSSGGGGAVIQPGSGGSIHTAAGLISKLSPSLVPNPHHPPLHPTLTSKPSLSTSPSSRAYTSPSSKHSSLRPNSHSPLQSSHSISTFAPSAAQESAVSTTTAASSSTTSSSTSAAHRPNTAMTSSAASASEDSSNIPLGLMMLIEALPGSNHGPLTAAGDFTSSKQEAVEQELTAVAIASDAPHKPEGISRLKSTAASPFRQTMEKRHRRARVDEESNVHNSIRPSSQLGSNETYELPPHIELRRSTSC